MSKSTNMKWRALTDITHMFVECQVPINSDPRLFRTSQRFMSQPASGTDGVSMRWTICLVPMIRTLVLDGLRLKPLWVNQFKTSTLQIFKISSEMFGDSEYWKSIIKIVYNLYTKNAWNSIQQSWKFVGFLLSPPTILFPQNMAFLLPGQCDTLIWIA